jgi:AraC-like DNA-binding protein
MEPALIKSYLPGTALEPYVRKYQVYRFSFEKDAELPVKFHTPRPEHTMTFYVREPQKFSSIDLGIVNTYPQCIINGMHNIPLNRYGSHDFCAIKVVLQPTTLSRLKIVKVKELNNTYVNAEDCFGSGLSILCEQLYGMDEIGKMIEAIESFLIQVFDKRCKTTEPIDKVCQLMIRQDDYASLNWLANQACLSARQFIRRFEEHVGVSPKLFQKIVRLDRAYRFKNAHPDKDWLYIALACGYYDYQHLVKDFKSLVNHTPTEFYKIEKASQEKFFGLYEG